FGRIFIPSFNPTGDFPSPNRSCRPALSRPSDKLVVDVVLTPLLFPATGYTSYLLDGSDRLFSVPCQTRRPQTLGLAVALCRFRVQNLTDVSSHRVGFGFLL